MTKGDKEVLGVLSALPALALLLYLAAPPPAAAQNCGQNGCLAGSCFSNGYCTACPPGSAGNQKCNGGSWGGCGSC
jgi:hypothetical protein